MREMFVDESASKGYVLAAAVIPKTRQTTLRKALRKLVLPGQSRLHFSKESDSRRREILSALTKLGVNVCIIQTSLKRQQKAREYCLGELVRIAVNQNVDSLVLERDETLVRSDLQTLYRETRGVSITYRHERPRVEPLLWIPDAVAWSHSKGGEWNVRIAPIVSHREVTR